jgi:Rrf2 family protein
MRALLELAIANNTGPLQIKVIAERQKISNKYLEQLVAILKTAGLVRSIRGPHGGYVLSSPPEEIKLSVVFRTLEGPVLTTECVEDASVCPNSADCATRKLWMQMDEAILGVLENKTLLDLVEMAQKSKQTMSYQI